MMLTIRIKPTSYASNNVYYGKESVELGAMMPLDRCVFCIRSILAVVKDR